MIVRLIGKGDGVEVVCLLQVGPVMRSWLAGKDIMKNYIHGMKLQGSKDTAGEST